MARAISPCIFCQIAGSSNSTPLLHSDDKVVAFKDINPSAFRHYLVVPVEHIPTVNDLQRRNEDYTLGKVPFGKSYDKCGETLLRRDAPQSNQYRFGFHQPPFNHLHLHCFALPFIPRWKQLKYMSLGPLGGFIEAEKLLEKIKPLSPIPP
ncbi:hypothetical protein ES332_A08G199900v1 [Gossypium tomentosum]|uniref:HIT domain-containing protein n=1 Tax=Gossypium tomentosum TaxID=34277 RepID=A0A5D2PL95_GOSTO|nr:hypothetical protein ES332_A08G199900v1 [Gossypium tomentosum]